MIEGNAPGQAHRQESASEHQLIGFKGGIGRLEAGIALDFEAADYIKNGDQTDFAHSCHLHATLSIEFPLVMRVALGLGRWSGQITVLLIATRQFLGTKPRRKARATGQRVIAPARINPEFGQQGRRSPARMRPAHLQDGLTHARRKLTQRAAEGPAHVRTETGTPLMLCSTTPFAHRPHGAAQGRRNLPVRLSSGGSFADVQPLLQSGRLSAP
jgi:hypothetical protein